MVFSVKCQQYLLNAGWYSSRKIGTLKATLFLLFSGYKIIPYLNSFITEFGGLEINYKTENGAEFLFHFDIYKAVRDFDIKWIKEDYLNRVNEKNLCVIGQAFSNHVTLMLSDSGKMYGGYDENLFLIGINVHDSIEFLCSGSSSIGLILKPY